MRTVIVVGGSAAGLAAVQSLRREGYGERILVIGAEPHPPYDRPPLSKGFIANNLPFEHIRLGEQALLDELGAEWLVPARACELDLERRMLRLEADDRLRFDGLVVATGVSPLAFPGPSPHGVYTLRGLDDAEALRTALASAPRVAVIGTGVLGMEFAATARKIGLDVTVIGNAPHPLARQFPAAIGELLAARHREAGVILRLNAPVAGFEETSGHVSGVRLADGEVIPAELALVAIGSKPNVDWLRSSGLPIGDGILCDARCRAAPGVYAAGDVASWWHSGYGARLRIEHRMNATEQAGTAVKNLLGATEDFRPIPFMWSDQHDVKLQSYGVFPASGEMEIEGDMASGRFVALCHHQGRVVGALGWNAAKTLRQSRMRLAEAMEDIRLDEPTLTFA
ncbi:MULTISPECIES: FAD-dependent oxidoreductase [unclassified Chelatococcus]|uniref:NAD(P)/FAD-dependent oxidoreductase n=1 Tax=unclassified Chelatococcus TaxID=2638111 RepID=UPI001BCFE9E5|nr:MULTISPECIES: FAD-dependent oxidoreductase [unclassified Chelatococcus]CAH1653346.1 Ferredoxin reductase [Hyphomicrobiales bacterium]MBS7742913.1 FAD-dependent oxidoreductase [Chelatococcus sp. HY11]MBX3541969.1 FAD-dependent oxidoreductase [Chelatococcus sp.]MCO5074139.1 FAD-dependent oxidoreductase [Chelatococcus sp.]CAH1694370.1 Ferredoxin reductase [Hyphomicrobiales bacterium]